MRAKEALAYIRAKSSIMLHQATLKSYVVNLNLPHRRVRDPNSKSVLTIDYPDDTIRKVLAHLRENGRDMVMESGEVNESEAYVTEMERRKKILCRWFQRRYNRRGAGEITAEENEKRRSKSSSRGHIRKTAGNRDLPS